MNEYLEVVRDNEGPERAVEWLFDNYSRMNQDMFLEQGWGELIPLELLLLRACSPAGVFTTVAKGAFLAQVQNNVRLQQVAEATFGTSDANFLSNLPTGCKQYRAKLKTLVLMVYEKGIRATDPNVN